MKCFGLTGKSLIHSFSQHYFTEKFLRENFPDCSYELFELQKPQDIPQLVKSRPDIAGLNVTIPFKESIIPYLDQCDEEATRIGAVNTIAVRRKKNNVMLSGFNTDAWGFENSTDVFLQYKKALVLGTGGSARAVDYVLKKWGIESLFVSRNPAGGNVISYAGLSPEIVARHPFIINTTPLGMVPHVQDFPPIPYEFISEKHFLYDLIYNPAQTVFMQKGQAAGARVMNGVHMLGLQAERAWEIWNA
ncbi:MAG: shikimate dehydrogenase family protein [Bacteroidales bacterium]